MVIVRHQNDRSPVVLFARSAYYPPVLTWTIDRAEATRFASKETALAFVAQFTDDVNGLIYEREETT